METILITPPSTLKCKVALPSSKSISNRALILNALSGGSKESLDRLSDCDDTAVMLRAFDTLRRTDENPVTIDVGAAGTSMRFLTAFLSCYAERQCLLTGSERMKQRPIAPLVNALRELGADIQYEGEEGFPPLLISGKRLAGGELELDSTVSSQYVSALLMIAPTFPLGLRLRLKGDVISRPYINMTLSMLSQWGVQSSFLDNLITIEHQRILPHQYTVEADWSAASYWYQIRELWKQKGRGNAEVELIGLREPSLQGDSHIVDVFSQLSLRKPLSLNLVDMPDMAQTVIVTACLLRVPFRIEGLQSLHIKETDRVQALQKELSKLGFHIEEPSHGVVTFDGEREDFDSKEAVIDTYHDHRMALSFAPVCLVDGKIRIREPHVVTKSYPFFWDDLRSAGFNIVNL